MSATPMKVHDLIVSPALGLVARCKPTFRLDKEGQEANSGEATCRACILRRDLKSKNAEKRDTTKKIHIKHDGPSGVAFLCKSTIALLPSQLTLVVGKPTCSNCLARKERMRGKKISPKVKPSPVSYPEATPVQV